MAYTTPPTAVSSTTATAADFNVLGADIEYLYGISQGVTFSGVQVLRTATQSIPDSTWTAVTWQTETGGFDVGGWWSSGTNIVVPAGAIPAGYTTIACRAIARTYFSSNGTGWRKIRFLVNGSQADLQSFPAISGDQTDVNVPAELFVASGDIITVEVYQNSGSSLNISSGGSKVSVIRSAPFA